MSILCMIRHGQASFGAADYDRLSPRGRKQARIVAEHLRALPTAIDAVYTGSLARQQQTVRALAGAFEAGGPALPPAVVVPELDEYDATGLWQHLYAGVLSRHPDLDVGKDRLRRDPGAFQKVFSRIVAHWMNGRDVPGHLESWPAFQRRVARGIHAIRQREGPGKTVAAVTSAGPVAVAVQMATAITDACCADLAWQILNAAITRFRYDADRFTLVGFNDVAALALAGGAELLTYR
jgi:broad specificity phosphatase PhoE